MDTPHQVRPGQPSSVRGRRREGDRRLPDRAVAPDGPSPLLDQSSPPGSASVAPPPTPGQGSWGLRRPQASDPATPAELNGIPLMRDG